jgi:hypothetical protein
MQDHDKMECVSMDKAPRKSSGIVGRPTQTLHLDDEREKPQICDFLKIARDSTKSEIESALCAAAGCARVEAVADTTSVSLAEIEAKIIGFEKSSGRKITSAELTSALATSEFLAKYGEKVQRAAIQKWLPSETLVL